MADVALGDIDCHFVWQAWHVWHWAGSGGALGTEWTGFVLTQLVHTPLVITQLAHTQLVHTPLVITQLVQDAAGCWRGRRGTLRHPLQLCVAGVARTGGVASVAGAAGTSAVALALLHTL